MNELHPVAVYRCDLPEKFGLPRQSGLVDLPGRVEFLPAYRDPAAIRGIEGFSHLWLLWLFSHNRAESDSLTVRPPRLGGNERRGVFATRSPYRPNPIGLSSVRLVGVEQDPRLGPVLHVRGGDLVSGTPILDVKPYLPFTDAHPDATAGFAGRPETLFAVELPPEARTLLSPDRQAQLVSLLSHDPRPAYQDDPTRVYGLTYADFDVRFSIEDGTLRVLSILPSSRDRADD